jgi:hypothetical protein
MFEMLFALYFSWYAVVVLSVWLLILFHIESEGWPIFTLMVLSLSIYVTSGMSLVLALQCMAAYIPLGIGWSMWRWKRSCSDVMENVDTKQLASSQKSDLRRQLMAKYHVSRITGWICAWPFSLIANVLGDLFDFISNLVKVYLIGVYNRISGNYLDQLKD